MSEHENLISHPTLTAEEEEIIEEKNLALRDEVDAEIATELNGAEEVPPAPQPSHIMIDLETLGNGNDAMPISIGACRFTATEIIDSFHVAIDPESCEQYGLKMDASTVLWWMHPDRDEARRRWLDMQRVDLPSVLSGFTQWAHAQPVVAIWGNGSTFDNVILRSAYRVTGLEYPVRFWQDQCYRTIKNRTAIQMVREGTHHDALDDAISQAKHLQSIMAQTNAPFAHLEKMQDAVRDYIDPGTPQDQDAFIHQLIEFLDGPEQREAMAFGRTTL